VLDGKMVIHNRIAASIEQQHVTYDWEHRMPGTTRPSEAEFCNAIIETV
jgi:isocitrate dehydrogenase